MTSRILIPALLGIAVALPAAAATTSTNGSSNAAVSTGQNATPQIAAKIRSNLEQAGFTDIQVVPQSFLVRAKDKQGNPAMMVMTPTSFTMVTATNAPTNSGSQSAQNGTNASNSSTQTGAASSKLGNAGNSSGSNGTAKE